MNVEVVSDSMNLKTIDVTRMTAAPLRITHRPDPNAKVVVVIPARDESERIVAALDALADAISLYQRVHVIIVANNCRDDTVRVSLQCCRAFDVSVSILDVTLSTDQGVGRARALGFSEALRLVPEARWLLGTDADCLVERHWIERTVDHLQYADVVCGNVGGIEVEARELPATVHASGEPEHRYHQAMLHSESLIDPDPLNPWPHHGRACGASQGFTREAYLDVGAYADLLHEEDREMIRRLRARDAAIVFADDVRVAASCRLDGRAPNGMAETLVRRTCGEDILADPVLEPAATHLLRVRTRAACRHLLSAGSSLQPILRRLGVTVHEQPAASCVMELGFGACWSWLEASSPSLARRRLRTSDLPLEIGALETVLTAESIDGTPLRSTAVRNLFPIPAAP